MIDFDFNLDSDDKSKENDRVPSFIDDPNHLWLYGSFCLVKKLQMTRKTYNV